MCSDDDDLQRRHVFQRYRNTIDLKIVCEWNATPNYGKERAF